MRIPIGTVCLIVYAPGRTDTLGKCCVVSGHIKRDGIGHDMLVDIADERDVPAAAKCLKPLTGDSGANFTLDKVKKPQKPNPASSPSPQHSHGSNSSNS